MKLIIKTIGCVNKLIKETKGTKFLGLHTQFLVMENPY